MRTGAASIDALVEAAPNARWAFGDYPTPEHFAIVLSCPEWVVMDHLNCWIILRLDGDTADLHWCCPTGANMRALRTLLAGAFDVLGLREVRGVTPEGHPNYRAARTLGRALGAVPDGDALVLTRDRFMEYT